MSDAASSEAPGFAGRLPAWVRVRPPTGDRYGDVRRVVHDLGLGTVCQEARCPNLSECWSQGTATLMLLGTDCTRRCGFCAVRTHWPAGRVDDTEPDRVARGVESWGLRYVVLTQVCRDDLADGGAGVMADTVRAIRTRTPRIRIELLIGDLAGNRDALGEVVASSPDVLAHNVETVERLSPTLRDRRASYRGSLELLAQARAIGGDSLVTKSSVMLGVGETAGELAMAFRDLRAAGVDLLTLGQYLRPSSNHVPVARFVPPEDFALLRQEALEAGFAGVESGPLVRSSYHAEALFERAAARRSG